MKAVLKRDEAYPACCLFDKGVTGDVLPWSTSPDKTVGCGVCGSERGNLRGPCFYDECNDRVDWVAKRNLTIDQKPASNPVTIQQRRASTKSGTFFFTVVTNR